jgi:hypothetical protein
MTTATTTTTDRRPPAPETGGPRQSRAVAARRWFVIASPVLAGVFAVLGSVADPAAGQSGREMWEIYAANPEPLQFKSLGFHWSYSFWIAPAMLLAAYVKGKGAWLANIAALLGFVGMTTLPGLVLIDFVDSAVGQLYGIEGTTAVNDLIEQTMWGLGAMAAPGMIGFVLGLPLAALALLRAGLVRWWAPVAVVAGYATFLLSDVVWWGCAATTVLFTAFAVAVERATRPAAS